MAQATGPHWFSRNPDKAWGEKLFLGFIPVFFAYNALVQGMGWLDAGNFWHAAQNLGMWLPYCVLLPLWLRRRSGVRWYESYWFKYQLFLVVWVFYCTYFHTEYFFELLGLRYRFPGVDLTFDATGSFTSAAGTFIRGSDSATVLAGTLASFGDRLVGQDIFVTSAAIEILDAGRIGEAGTQDVRLNARNPGARIGGDNVGTGYVLSAAEVGHGSTFSAGCLRRRTRARRRR